jgi:DNA-binding LacI/PurR family transcriptional regulator
VARRAGVSQSAVSRYFTPGRPLSEKLAAKVRAAAEELGYRPNAVARSLTTGRSRIVGLVVAYMENEFFSDAVERLSVALQDRGYHVLLFMASRTVGDVEPVLRRILDHRIDGIVMLSVSLSSVLAERCRAFGIPVVLFNRDQISVPFSAVTSDNLEGGRIAARLVLAERPRAIGHLAGFEGASTQRDREKGFLEVLAEAGRQIDLRTVGNYHFAQATEAAREMFDRPDRPDAVFVGNDHMAFATLNVVRHELGLRVPEDVSVVGFDDVPQAAWPCFDLTTVRQHVGRMVSHAVDALVSEMEGGDEPPVKTRLLPSPVRRGSTRDRG